MSKINLKWTLVNKSDEFNPRQREHYKQSAQFTN